MGYVALKLLCSRVLAADISSPCAIIDGDTLDMDGIRIRLCGIDAPEMKQTCQGQDGLTYECGRDSAAIMRELTRDRPVACESRDRDQYGRAVAVCGRESGEIIAPIVRRGWAVDWPRYSHGRYRPYEATASRRGIGDLVWAVPATVGVAARTPETRTPSTPDRQ